MSSLKSKHSKTLEQQATSAVGVCLIPRLLLSVFKFTLNNKKTVVSFLLPLPSALSLSMLMLTAHAETLDGYVIPPASTPSNTSINTAKSTPNIAANTATPSITEIAEGLDNGGYQTYPLQSIIDPTTGIAIDDTYSIEVPEKLSLLQAQHVLIQVSPKLAGNNAAIASNQLQAEATEGLNKPLVFLRAGATRYRVDADINLTDVKSGINSDVNNSIHQALDDIPNLDPNVIPDIPSIISSRIPDNYDLKHESSNVSAGVAVLWPVYTAGRTQAITELANARTEESQADALIDSDSLQTTLIDRYFTAQLAMIAAYLREDALNTIKETDYTAERLLQEGFISRVERLEAKTALAEAESESIKARHDAQLAMTALQRLLRTPNPVKPVTPLFVSSKPLPPLDYFQKIALQNHPGLKKVDAKYAQAESLNNLSDTGYKPTVSVFGYHEIDEDPSWIAGISASWKLWGGLDKQALNASGKAQMRQALLAKIDASDNILLLVEKNWQSVENARIRYHSLNSNILLAQELLRLKRIGLQEGVNTALDVATAQTKYLQARTEQTAAANDYVQALAALMESIGTPEAFNDYMAAADIKLPTVY